MIAGQYHSGSGLGDQLFRYITTRSLAKEKNLDWAMLGSFKGDFFKGEFHGNSLLAFEQVQESKMLYWDERVVRDTSGTDIRSYDPEVNFVSDNTVIDGSFEDDKYWRHKMPEIDKWLAVEPLEVSDDVCVIGFRGGEYYSDTNLGLPKSYFDEAMKAMPSFVRYEVHTDDVEFAKQFFPDIPIISNVPISHSKHSNMGYNWRAMRYAKYSIIANSSFYILPRILSKGITIAPRFWARRNAQTWARPSCYYPEFIYV